MMMSVLHIGHRSRLPDIPGSVCGAGGIHRFGTPLRGVPYASGIGTTGTDFFDVVLLKWLGILP